jgi:hypothetical protein
MYVRAERNCDRAEGVKRTFTDLLFRKQSVRFSHHRGEVKSPPGGNLLVATGQETQELSVMLGPFIGLGAEHDGGRAPTLRDDDWLSGVSNPFQHACGILPEIGDGDDGADSPHDVAPPQVLSDVSANVLSIARHVVSVNPYPPPSPLESVEFLSYCV